jgi:hypothetical protein
LGIVQLVEKFSGKQVAVTWAVLLTTFQFAAYFLGGLSVRLVPASLAFVGPIADVNLLLRRDSQTALASHDPVTETRPGLLLGFLAVHVIVYLFVLGAASRLEDRGWNAVVDVLVCSGLGLFAATQAVLPPWLAAEGWWARKAGGQGELEADAATAS